MSQRAFKIIGNWKMNHSVAELDSFIQTLASAKATWAPAASQANSQSGASLEVGILPQSPLIARAVAAAKASALPLAIGAQNAHGSANGAFTGETSASVLRDLGATLALVAHSERRQYFGETDASAITRAEGLLNQNTRVLFCIGETKDERSRGETNAVIEKQLKGLGLTPERKALFSKAIRDQRFFVAYEPVWAIGTGLTPTTAEAEEAHQKAKAVLRTELGLAAAERLFVLYGGSATPENASAFLAMPSIDGLLIGGASLDSGKFLKLIAAAQSLLPSA